MGVYGKLMSKKVDYQVQYFTQTVFGLAAKTSLIGHEDEELH